MPVFADEANVYVFMGVHLVSDGADEASCSVCTCVFLSVRCSVMRPVFADEASVGVSADLSSLPEERQMQCSRGRWRQKKAEREASQ